MSTVGLELTNFIVPNLTWKTVTKRFRSAPKRSRKPVTRNFTVWTELSDKGTGKLDDMTISDTEKHGVAILGRRFSDKIEHVPIKKRRLIQSPSPPPRTPSPHFGVPEPKSKGKRQRMAADASTTANFSRDISKVKHNKFDCHDDFSGIEILAAVACSDSMIDDVDHDEQSSPTEESTREGVDSSASAVPFEEAAASPRDEDKMEASSLHDIMVTVSQRSSSVKDSRTAEGSASSRDERLHWDLNVVMDAWEKPCDVPCIDSLENTVMKNSITTSEKLQNLESCEAQGEVKDICHKPVDGAVLADVHGNSHISVELKGLSLGASVLGREQPKPEACPDYDGLPLGNAQESSTRDVVDVKASSQIVDAINCLDHSASLEVSEENRDATPSGRTVNTNVCDSDVQLGKMSTDSVQVEMCNVASPSVPELERVTCEINSTIMNEDSVYSGGESGFHKDRKHVQGMLSVGSCELVAPISPGNEPSRAEKLDDHQYSPNNGDTSTSNVSAAEGQPVVTADVKGQADEVSVVNATDVDSPAHPGSSELMQKSSVDSAVGSQGAGRMHDNGPTISLIKATAEDPSDDSYESDVYQAEKVPIVENVSELQAGYDSQFEDGELREPDAYYYWDENEEDGEVEHVDYGSECEEERLCGLDNEKEMKVERGSSPGYGTASIKSEHCGAGDAPRDDSVGPKTRTSEMTTDKDFLSGAVGSRASNRELPPCTVGPDSIHKDAKLRSRGDHFYNWHSRDERDAASKKFMERDKVTSHIRGRSPGYHRFADPSAGYWNSERHYLPTYRGSYPSGPPRPKGVVEGRRYIMTSNCGDSDAKKFTAFDSGARRPYVNRSYESIGRRRSPTIRDDAYGMHAGMLPRDTSPISNQYRRYPQGPGRGVREEYRRHMPDDNIEYSSHMVHRLARGERSISPLGRGRPHYNIAYKKSRSRSRSRSPTAYFPPRTRHRGPRFQNRSPDFRSGARVDRMRFPFQKRFTGPYEEGFVSPTRSRFSPQRNSRWVDDRNGALDNFRGRKSPVFRQNQRYDLARSTRRFYSDDQFRPMIQPRKFPDMAITGRGDEYEGSDDGRRKRVDVLRRVRHYDTDGVVRRFRCKAEDSFAVDESHDYDNCDSDMVTDRRPRDAHRTISEE